MSRLFRPWQILAVAIALGVAALIPTVASHDHSVAAADARTLTTQSLPDIAF